MATAAANAGSQTSGSDPLAIAQKDLIVTAWVLAGLLGIGVSTVFFASVDRRAPALLWCFGCLVVGFVGGFLFGFPRVIVEGADKADRAASAVEDASKAFAQRLGVNTNLEQVSDWLTKIIVGVGLVELKNVPNYVGRAGHYIGAGFGDAPQAVIFQERTAAGIVVSFLGIGALAGYLLTRMFFSAAFARADAGTLTLAPEQKRAIATTPLEEDGKKVELPEDTKAAFERLIATPQRSVPESSVSLSAWARAQFEAEHYDNAISGYKEAVDQDALNPRLRHNYAIALKYAGRRADAMLQLEEARRLVRSHPDRRMRRQIYASYTFNALYLNPPESFTRARDAALEYVNTSGSLPSGEIWLNLACAYGQQFTYESQKPAPAQATLDQIRGEALNALKRAVGVEPEIAPRAQQLLEGQDPEDDDLVVFGQRQEFRAAVGLP